MEKVQRMEVPQPGQLELMMDLLEKVYSEQIRLKASTKIVMEKIDSVIRRNQYIQPSDQGTNESTTHVAENVQLKYRTRLITQRK